MLHDCRGSIDFESLRWMAAEEVSTAMAIEATASTTSEDTADSSPVILRTGEIDSNGETIPSDLARGIHWTDNQWPAWTGYEQGGGSVFDSPLPSTPSAVMSTSSSSTGGWQSTAPLSIGEIAKTFDRVRKTFGFQRDAAINAFELLMSQLDSRASRSDPRTALLTLHAEYIGGPHANFRQWYFASKLDKIDAARPPAGAFIDVIRRESYKGGQREKSSSDNGGDEDCDEPPLKEALDAWAVNMSQLNHQSRINDLVIWLLCWTEANQLRFMPECLAFIVKCARDHYAWITNSGEEGHDGKEEGYEAIKEQPEGFFLDKIVTPLYKCYRENNYYLDRSGSWIKRECDHKNTIGYDDMNQLFWSNEGLSRIKTASGKVLIDLSVHHWFLGLADVQWKPAFRKTFRETRTWLHMVTNFSRIWVIHGSVFWFYTALNAPSLYTVNYSYLHPSKPQPHIQWTVASLGGMIGPFITCISLIGEYLFVPRSFSQARPVLPRLSVAIAMLIVLAGPAIYNLAGTSWTDSSLLSNVLAGVLFGLAIIYTLYFSIQPLAFLIGSTTDIPVGSRVADRHERRFLANYYFTAQFPKLSSCDQMVSWGMAMAVFAAKLAESYVFLTLSLRDPIRELSVLTLNDRCVGDLWFGKLVCNAYPSLILAGMIVTDMTLFLLDTYLWYVIFNTMISVGISFANGGSKWTPWRNIYSQLPQRMASKLLWTASSQESVKFLWNSIIDSMLRGHLMSRLQADKLIYTSKEPVFFTAEQDRSIDCGSVLGTHGEAYRRISFFAQSLATSLPPADAIQAMPSFTVLIPHYAEKILLGLSETIKVETGVGSEQKITILEYLQNLHPHEWANFSQESKQLERRTTTTATASMRTINTESLDFESAIPPRTPEGYNIAFRTLGFSKSDPRSQLRTQLWCSLRTQTLYRTVAGFMNYPSAIKVLKMAENESMETWPTSREHMVDEMRSLVARKFRLIVAMQKYSEMTRQQLDDVEKLFTAFPEIVVVYVERVSQRKSSRDKEEVYGGTENEGSLYDFSDSSIEERQSDLKNATTINNQCEDLFYASMIDGTCPLLESGRRHPRLRIRISGEPILGDGKSDNQNHALPFYRGEYIQLVDANQDHYLEECLKIRNVLHEFDNMTFPTNPYTEVERPVAIVGAREYVFSENYGVLGDVAAGKEQTFGTLFARTLAKIGGKLHYGHPDFLNGIFMTTRGGVSKAQRGLHLNEDIYAGMTAVSRGGRIKHTEYIQCGKGRDLGFISILNFISKIGAGMGEQVLSREYFHLGTQLPFDRFLSFFYAHPGFHLNNVFIMLSLDMFLTVMVWLSSIASEAPSLCKYDSRLPPTQIHTPIGCKNVLPLLDWIRRCVVSIFVVFFISLCPLFLQELTEKGFIPSIKRELKHLLSMSMLFEIFVCRVYSRSFLNDLSIGGARYLATGRGLAVRRMPFYSLYEGYASDCLGFGLRCLAMLVVATVMYWHPSYLWFWVTTVALCFSPFIYNPHQFAFVDFFVDYRRLMQWFARSGGGANSWVAFVRANRAKITGTKDPRPHDTTKPNVMNVLVSQVGPAFVQVVVLAIPYLYICSQRITRFQREPTSAAMARVLVVAFLPMAVNVVLNLVMLPVSICLGMMVGPERARHGSDALSFLTHTFGLIAQILCFHLMYVLERQVLATTFLGLVIARSMQRMVTALITVLILPRQRPSEDSNDPWWTGQWGATASRLGPRLIYILPLELLAKTTECTRFAHDFLACHFLLICQSPFLFLPYIDNLHTRMILWLGPGKLSRELPSDRRRRQLVNTARKYCVLFFGVSGALVTFILLPLMLPTVAHMALQSTVGERWPTLLN